MTTPTYQVLWPLARIQIEEKSPVKGLPDLSGKTIAELWDYIFRGDIAYEIFRKKLQERFPGVRFVPFAKFGNIHGPKQREILDRLPQMLRDEGVDAVITGIGA